MSNEHTFDVRVAVLLPAGRGRMGQPRTGQRTYTVTVEADSDALAMGLASVEALRLAEAEGDYPSGSQYPYTIGVERSQS